jgi:hypothetical protein
MGDQMTQQLVGIRGCSFISQAGSGPSLCHPSWTLALKMSPCQTLCSKATSHSRFHFLPLSPAGHAPLCRPPAASCDLLTYIIVARNREEKQENEEAKAKRSGDWQADPSPVPQMQSRQRAGRGFLPRD